MDENGYDCVHGFDYVRTFLVNLNISVQYVPTTGGGISRDGL